MVIKINEDLVERLSRNISINEIIEFSENLLQSAYENKIKVTDKKVVPPKNGKPYHFHLELETVDDKGVKIRKVIAKILLNLIP